jgi:hypothetical protein
MTRGIAFRTTSTAARSFLAAALAAAAFGVLPAAAQATVYWANYDHGRIGKADNSGTPGDPSFIGSPVGPFGVAAFENTLYWADYDTGAIGRANVIGATATDVDSGFVTGQDGVFGVAANESYVYWGTVGGKIGRATLAADGSVTGVDPSFVTGAGYVVGVAIADGAIFWTDADGNRIGRATLNADGSVDTVTNNVQAVNGAAGVAFADGRLYWANSFGGSIGRASVASDGTLSGVDQSFIISARDPAGVAVLGRDVVWANMSSSQPSKTALSRAQLAADGSVSSVAHEIAFDDSGMFGVALDAPVDREPPVVTMTPTAPPSGSWFNSANSGTDGVRVDVSATDPSGVTGLSCREVGGVVHYAGGTPGNFILGDGVHNITCTATDGARRRNSGAASGSTAFPVTLSIDQTPPSISCTAAPPDWVAFNVFFGCSASDDGSGLANPADASFFVSTSVADGSADANAPSDTHSVSDVAGNSHESSVLHAKVDLAPPVITCPAVAPVLVLGGPNPPIVATVTDQGSGPASPTATGQTSSAVLGPQTSDVAAADRVGNRTSATCPYSVEAPASKYQFKGLRNLFRHSFRHGKRVPLHFRLRDAKGKPVTNAVARLSVVPAVQAQSASLKKASKPSDDVFRHVGRGHYWYVFDTGRLPGPGKYEVRVSLDDGSVHTAPLVVRAKRHGHWHWPGRGGDDGDDN